MYDTFCNDLAPVLGVVGWVILGIKIAVPIILIVVGMIDLAKAVTQNDEKEVKKAEKILKKEENDLNELIELKEEIKEEIKDEPKKEKIDYKDKFHKFKDFLVKDRSFERKR